MKLKAYMVYGDGNYHECCDLIYAHNRQEARVCGYGNSGACEGFEFIEIRANRNKAADEFAEGDLPYSEYNERILRKAGFTSEDGKMCDSCGLNDFEIEEFLVCDDCNQCPECGCDCQKEEPELMELKFIRTK